MHSLVRRYLKTGIGFLGIGLALGLWMMVERDLYQRYPSPFLASAHTHVLVVGFVMMMILGVALWLFPRPAKEDTRYTPAAAAAAYWLLAGGTAVRVAGEVARASVDAPWLRLGTFAGGVLQIAALALFFFTIWTRIRGVGSPAREERGERF